MGAAMRNRLNGSPVGVMIAARITFTIAAWRRYLTRNSGVTSPIMARKAMMTGISKTRPKPSIMASTSVSCSRMVRMGFMSGPAMEASAGKAKGITTK